MASSRIPYVFKVGFGPEVTGFRLKVKTWAYNLSGFNKYGLMRDDCLMETTDVVEAIKRLPPKLYDERQFRYCGVSSSSGIGFAILASRCLFSALNLFPSCNCCMC